MTSYIITIKKYDGHVFTDFCDGIIKIVEKSGENIIELYDDNKDLLCENNLSNENINFSFRKLSNSCQVIIRSFDKIYGLEFDKNSFASFNEFKTNINKLIKSKIKYNYYPSGNLKTNGPALNDKLNGYGMEFYDCSENKFKYIGEFEDDVYDGEGTFTSKDGLISVHINNISEGVPIDYGLLTVKGLGEYDINFENHKEFTLSDNNFCYKLAEKLIPNLKEIIFNSLELDDKINLLWTKLNKLTVKLDNMDKKPSLFSFF
jgi:hypothetical protein